ncbi:thioesterase family protein [Nocardia cyriacigeorgica]|uniref:thioesterase family protein n=1 Tax=Nocardia cyriacigeorgica TaxID=135487 RepID=UPI002458E5B3|nr:thioesterase family protein [Nocardia cyriacigeorgica]
MDAFYLPDSADPDLFHPTELTRGPWSPDAQHGGAPSALLGYVIERCAPRPQLRVARVTVEFLRKVPIAPLRAEAQVVEAEARVGRPGRGIELVEATLRSEQGPVLKATAWRMQPVDPPLDVPPQDFPARTPGPDTVTPSPEHSFPSSQPVGFHTGVEYRFVSGAFQTPGPAVCWIRLRYPVVAGTAITPLQRALAAADFGNGVSSVLPWGRYFFVNADLTVTLHRDPVGEWVCLDAVTYPERSGIGLAESRLGDVDGPIGRGTQTLLLGTR